MSFLGLFGSKTRKKLPRTYDPAGLTEAYLEARELLLRGKLDQALEGFKSIYEFDSAFRDVANIVEDSYEMPNGELIAKYKAQFREEATKESREDGGAGPPDVGAGPAPVPAPRRPVAPSGSFRAEKRPDEEGR